MKVLQPVVVVNKKIKFFQNFFISRHIGLKMQKKDLDWMDARYSPQDAQWRILDSRYEFSPILNLSSVFLINRQRESGQET